MLFHRCFGIRISSPFHLDTLNIPIQNTKCPENAKNELPVIIFSPTIFVKLELCRLCMSMPNTIHFNNPFQEVCSLYSGQGSECHRCKWGLYRELKLMGEPVQLILKFSPSLFSDVFDSNASNEIIPIFLRSSGHYYA